MKEPQLEYNFSFQPTLEHRVCSTTFISYVFPPINENNSLTRDANKKKVPNKCRISTITTVCYMNMVTLTTNFIRKLCNICKSLSTCRSLYIQYLKSLSFKQFDTYHQHDKANKIVFTVKKS